MKINFSAKDFTLGDEKKNLIVASMKRLGRAGINKYHGSHLLATEYSMKDDYEEFNDTTKHALLNYCKDQSGVGAVIGDFNWANENAFRKQLNLAFSNKNFEWTYFAIQTEALNQINADNEVEDILQIVNVTTVGMGDSKSYNISSKSLFQVQDGSYGNNTTRFQEHFASSITVTPTPKIASVDFDVMQFTAIDYDLGRDLAKIAMSFRTQMYKDAVEEAYDTSDLLSTPFYRATFDKIGYLELRDRVQGANGTSASGVMALGTTVSFANMSDTVNQGYTTLDEINKTGFIGNLFGVRSAILEQAVDSTTAQYEFQVPNDRVLLVSNGTADKIIKLVKEGNIMVTNEDGREDSLYRRIYKYQDFWKVQKVTQSAYAVQMV